MTREVKNDFFRVEIDPRVTCFDAWHEELYI